jgi:DNA-binding NarL/FixJ family response regulator
VSSRSDPDPIRIGLVSDEPIRLAGLASIFDLPAQHGHARLLPVSGPLEKLLIGAALEYLVVDLSSCAGGIETLDAIRRARPDIRLIVIGPEGDDELVLSSIIAGARAYLDLAAGPEMVRKAIEVVTEGSIWAPRRLLSKLIDRLLKVPDSSLTSVNHRLTVRERQVLDLILMAQSNREIASHLGIEERTVKAYVGRLMRKTGADNRIKLTMSALNFSLTPHDGEMEDRDAGVPNVSLPLHGH